MAIVIVVASTLGRQMANDERVAQGLGDMPADDSNVLDDILEFLCGG